MKALTIHQPWATAYVLGPKGPENRSWAPPRATTYPFELAIHASAREGWPAGSARIIWDHWELKVEEFDQLPKYPVGAIIGVVEIVGVFDLADKDRSDPWAVGPLLWRSGRRWTLREPIPAKGRQRLWTLDEETAAEVRRRMVAVPTAAEVAQELAS